MTITYRDEIGYITTKINSDYGVGFDGNYAYFTDDKNNEHRIPIVQISSIC